MQISASAVAKKVYTAGSKSALFASNTACGGTNGVYIVSNNVNVIGGTHSNGNLYLNANNDQLGPTSYGGPNGCTYSNNGNNNTFGGQPGPIQDPNTEGWPEDFIANPPTCTNTASSFSWSGNNITIPPGVYCATGSSGITISGNNVVGNGVTFKASKFSLTGNNFAMTAGFEDLLFYYTGTGTFSVDGQQPQRPDHRSHPTARSASPATTRSTPDTSRARTCRSTATTGCSRAPARRPRASTPAMVP